MKTLAAIWLPTTFTIVCVCLCVISLLFTVPAFFGACDINSRYKEYKRLKGKYINKKVARKFRYSMCQRLAIVNAASNTQEVKDYFRSLGYRFYHILPDGTFSIKNNCYLKPKFYKNLMGRY